MAVVETMVTTLDGVDKGIAVEILGKENNEKNKFMMYQNKYRLFPNIEVAKIVAKFLYPENRYRLYIYLGDNLLYRLTDIQVINNALHMYTDDDKYHIITQTRKYSSNIFGYMVFEDGDTVRCDAKTYGHKRQYELIKLIRDTAQGILMEKWPQFGITQIEKRQREYILHIKGTTAKIHFLHGAQLMDINQERKEKGQKCFVFDKNMDKFTTFYVFIDRDVAESKGIEGISHANNLLTTIVSDLQEFYPDLNPKFVPIERNCYVELED